MFGHSMQRGGSMLTTDQKHELQVRLASAIANVDRAGLMECSVKDITWSLPGTSRVSGGFVGADEVLGVGRTFAEVGYHFEV
jgi:ketosteroid isomerase-like protein